SSVRLVSATDDTLLIPQEKLCRFCSFCGLIHATTYVPVANFNPGGHVAILTLIIILCLSPPAPDKPPSPAPTLGVTASPRTKA
ncbi:hypothetical protein J6590_101769, partial [Homalodisca vitripennis]